MKEASFRMAKLPDIGLLEVACWKDILTCLCSCNFLCQRHEE